MDVRVCRKEMQKKKFCQEKLTLPVLLGNKHNLDGLSFNFGIVELHGLGNGSREFDIGGNTTLTTL